MLGLSGIGVNSAQPLTIAPSTMTFPAQPVGDPSAVQTFSITNPGDDSVAIDRTFTTGDFAIIDGGGCGGATLGPLGSCSIGIQFDPTATGNRTGKLTLTDSLSGAPSVFNLAGTGITGAGALTLGQSSLAFGPQDKGTTSTSLGLQVVNPGNSPVTINGIETTSDFAVVSQYQYYPPANCGGVLAPGAVCTVSVAFSPTQPSGPESGTLTLHSTAGTMTAALSGTSVVTAEAVHLTPTVINFGGALFGSTNADTGVKVYVDNTGGASVTFLTPLTITGVSPAPGADFPVADGNCYQYLPSTPGSYSEPMPPGASCYFTVRFSPSLTGTEQATLALSDSAGKQTIALSGVGTATTPAVTITPAVLAFDRMAVGTTSNLDYSADVAIENTGTQTLTVSSVKVSAGSADFSLLTAYGNCSGRVLTSQESCNVIFAFHPSALGYRTGTVTFTDSLGNTYTAGLAGYSVAAVNDAVLSPQALVLPSLAIRPAVASSGGEEISLVNNGNSPLTIGTISGTNVSPAGDFPTIGSGLYNTCTGVTVQPGGSCEQTVGFEPLALGPRTGSLTFPVTYADQTTATLTASLSGTGLADTGSATLSPPSVAFPSTVAGTGELSYQNESILILTNTGTVNLTTGAITGADLTTTAGKGGDFLDSYPECNDVTLTPGGTCNMGLYFQPLTTGQKAGSLKIPVTYSGGATVTLTSTLGGLGVAPAPAAQVDATELAFNPEVVGTTDTTNVQTVSVINTGNATVTFKSTRVSSNFTLTNNYCGTTLSTSLSCTISVGFTPLATTTPGTVNGTLTIVDNTPESPHVVKLTGKALSTAQALSLSQTTVSFANQQVSTASPAQAVYLTDMDNSYGSNNSEPSQIQINSIVLGGANASDFTETQMCGGNLGFTILGRTDCIISVAFAPGASSPGARTATVTITPAQGSPLVITLKGTAFGPAATLSAPVPGTVLAGPGATFSWAAQTGATGYSLRLGTTAGGNNVYGSGEITATSVKPASLPTNGETIYATLATFYGTVQVSNAYTFTAATQAAILAPTPGATLASPGQVYAWTSGTGATSYALWLGSTGKGSNNLYASGPKTSNSVTVGGLPANGETIYARLITNFNGAMAYTDYIYNAATPAAPAASAPSNKSAGAQ